jgi:uncharacterized protein
VVKLPVLPEMRCDDGCGACCGPVPASIEEYEAVVALAKSKGIKPVAHGLSCPFYQGGKCAVYEARPTMCRVFGHVPEMPCIHGYNVNVDPGLVKEAIQQSGARGNAVMLHQALVDFGVAKSIEAVVGEEMAGFLRYAISKAPAAPEPIFKPEIVFLCPFCEKEVQAGFEGADREPVAFHQEPVCKKFDDLEIDDFMAECRALFEAQQPN